MIIIRCFAYELPEYTLQTMSRQRTVDKIHRNSCPTAFLCVLFFVLGLVGWGLGKGQQCTALELVWDTLAFSVSNHDFIGVLVRACSDPCRCIRLCTFIVFPAFHFWKFYLQRSISDSRSRSLVHYFGGHKITSWTHEKPANAASSSNTSLISWFTLARLALFC